MEFIYLAIGLIVGAIIVFFLLNGKLKKLETKNVLSNQQLAHEQNLAHNCKQNVTDFSVSNQNNNNS